MGVPNSFEFEETFGKSIQNSPEKISPQRKHRVLILGALIVGLACSPFVINDAIHNTYSLENGLVCSDDARVAVTPGEKLIDVAKRDTREVGLPVSDAERLTVLLTTKNAVAFTTNVSGDLIIGDSVTSIKSSQTCTG